MAGLAGYAFVIGGVAGSIAAFVVASVVIVLLLLVLAVAIGTAQERFVATLQAGTTQVKRWGGVILIVVGIWFLVLAAFAETFAEVFPV